MDVCMCIIQSLCCTVDDPLAVQWEKKTNKKLKKKKRNYHNIVNQLYLNKLLKNKRFGKHIYT